MQSTLVGGSSARPQGAKATLYVGGLSDGVNEAALHAAFIPFGEIKDVSIPIDNATGSHRGFGFVEFEEAADAAAAALNMDSAELFGRTLRVNQSQSRIGGGGNKREAVWADEDAWNERAEADNLDASAAFKRREVGGGGGGGGAAAAEAAAREQQRPSSSVGAAAPDPMAAAEAALG